MKVKPNISIAILVYALVFLLRFEYGCGSILGGFSTRSCLESEKQALLQFKRSLVNDSNIFSSWVGDDCCVWYGVGCNNNNKSRSHVIKLDLRNSFLTGDRMNPSLLHLKYLSYLDLSYNSFDGIQIPEFFGSFKDLTYLNLSLSGFEGLVPHHLGNLSSLRYLDLYYNDGLSIDSIGWLSKLSLLQHLDLSFVNLSRATDWFSAINMLPRNSLLVLKLADCGLPYTNIPPQHLPYLNFTSLVSLDLRGNQLDSSMILWVSNMSALQYLNLANNNFHGPVPESIGMLTSLIELYLSSNNYQGSIPESIGRLTSLSKLYLSNNRFNGSIPTEIVNLTQLTDLQLSSNRLRGYLPDALGELSKLETFDISNNTMSGSISKMIGQLSNLQTLRLSSNSWEGVISEDHFAKLTRLTTLSISSNSDLVLNVSFEWIPLFQLQLIELESLKVGPKFPSWLLTQRHIVIISMRNTSIADTLPADWFVNVLLSQALLVDLSDNGITGEQLSLIPKAAAPYLEYLVLSSNSLSGGFPTFVCNLRLLIVLVLSNNNFSGDLPHCLENLIYLQELDLMNNSLSGPIPAYLGSLGTLRYLNLHNNKFDGKLPLSFNNMTSLVTLDFGKNNLRDILPSWTGEQLPKLKFLILSSNNFYGKIPTQLCHLTSIKFINFGQNHITGNLPPCFGNFTSMFRTYHYNPGVELDDVVLEDDMGGSELQYTSTLQYLVSIDLSDNNISGEIPEEFMHLDGLQNLDLSGNHLTGKIPDRIGKLEGLESLDHSRNQLYGFVPDSLSDLNFLRHLNLSFNSLSGRLPTGNQLQTLNDPSIYEGNIELCGQPILKPCPTDTESGNANEQNHNEEEDDDDDEHLWLYAGMGPGVLVGFLGFCASLHFVKSWRYTYFHFLELLFDKLSIVIAMKAAWLRRKFCN